MIIPNKYSGYQAGIRLYPGGGGGGGGASPMGTGDSPVGLPTSDGAGPFIGLPTTPPPPPTYPWGTTQQSKADYYNQQLGAGQNDAQIRANIDSTLGGSQSDANWGQLVQTAGMSSPTGRPLPGSAQFFQPVYQQQYQDYNMGNPMGISQYGQRSPYGGGFSGTGLGSMISQAFGGQQSQPQTPFSYQQPAQQPQMNWQTGQMTQPVQQNSTPQPPQTSMFGGQMQGGGYGSYGSNNPFSPYSNSFLNMDQNLNQGTQADKANVYRSAIQNGFGDQQIYNQATGLFGQQSPQAWGYLQGSAMGMTPGLAQGSEQDKIGFYQGARNQGFNDQTIRNAANQMIGNQSQGDWSYLQNQSGYGSGFGGYGNQFMPQMQNPYSYQPTQASTPYQPPMARTSSGPSQAIVGRSSQMRGTPNVMRRAEGGIASLMDEDE